MPPAFAGLRNTAACTHSWRCGLLICPPATPALGFGLSLVGRDKLSPRMRATRIQPWVERSAERSEARSGTQGWVGKEPEPAKRVIEILRSDGEAGSSRTPAASSAHFVGFRTGGIAFLGFRASGRSTPGFIRVARVAGLAFLRLRLPGSHRRSPRNDSGSALSTQSASSDHQKRPNPSASSAGLERQQPFRAKKRRSGTN